MRPHLMRVRAAATARARVRVRVGLSKCAHTSSPTPPPPPPTPPPPPPAGAPPEPAAPPLTAPPRGSCLHRAKPGWKATNERPTGPSRRLASAVLTKASKAAKSSRQAWTCGHARSVVASAGASARNSRSLSSTIASKTDASSLACLQASGRGSHVDACAVLCGGARVGGWAVLTRSRYGGRRSELRAAPRDTARA